MPELNSAHTVQFKTSFSPTSSSMAFLGYSWMSYSSLPDEEEAVEMHFRSINYVTQTMQLQETSV